MPKYIKKPIVVEANQFTEQEIPKGVLFDYEMIKFYVVTIHNQRAYLEIGDWVITEPDGIHHYPCKPDIFEKIYTLQV